MFAKLLFYFFAIFFLKLTTFFWKVMIIFFWFFPMVPHMEFLFTLWYPKGSKKNWPKCLWPKCHWSKFHWPKCHQPNSHWPKLLSGQSVSGQSVTGQMVTLAKWSFWPKCHSGQSVSAKVWFSHVRRFQKKLGWLLQGTLYKVYKMVHNREPGLINNANRPQLFGPHVQFPIRNHQIR